MPLQSPFSWEAAAAVGTGALIATALATTVTAKYLGSDPPQKPTPRKWLRVGTVGHLAIYPIKSCKAVPIQAGIITNLGLKGIGSELLRDRVFMVVDSKGLFQVQKEFPKLACIEFSAQNSSVTLKAPGVEDCNFELPAKSPGNVKTCQIFLENKLRALDCGEGPAAWLDSFLGSNGLRLVYHHTETSQRHLSDMQKQFPLTSEQDVATFQNYTSYLLIGQESVAELNKHLKHSVTFDNFRPSILVEGLTEPFSEIKWGFVKIGHDVIFKASKPCERCSIVTVNQSTGIRDPTGDPLKTLTKLKPEFDDDQVRDLLKNKGIMGLQMGLHPTTPQHISIKVGDPVYVALL